MTQFKVIYYIILVMFFLLVSVFFWGISTYKKAKSNIRFLNKPLLTLTLSIGIIGFILAWIPIFLKIWNHTDEFIKSDWLFILILVFELIFLIGFLILSYIYAFDYGIVLEKNAGRLQFFGQAIKINKIVALEEKKFSLKIIYEQGFKGLKKKITIFTPNAKNFVRENLAYIIAANQKEKKVDIDVVAKETITKPVIESQKEKKVDIDVIDVENNVVAKKPTKSKNSKSKKNL